MHNTYLLLAYGVGVTLLLLLFVFAWHYHRKYFVLLFCLFPTVTVAMQSEKPRNNSCPKYSVDQCKLSFEDLVEAVSKCDFTQAKNCTIIFMESLNTLDEQAPFYSSLFDGFMMQGDIEAYKQIYRKLSPDDKDILFSLSAALAIEVRNHFEKIGLLDADGKDEINDAVALRYRIDMKRPFEKARPRNERQFIKQARKSAQFITWPKESKDIQFGIRAKLRDLRKKNKADPNDPTPEFQKEDYAFAESP